MGLLRKYKGRLLLTRAGNAARGNPGRLGRATSRCSSRLADTSTRSSHTAGTGASANLAAGAEHQTIRRKRLRRRSRGFVRLLPHVLSVPSHATPVYDNTGSWMISKSP